VARTFTVSQIAARVRRLADEEAFQRIVPAELVDYISASYCELYEILVKSGLPYFESAATFVTDGTNGTYPLPSDFFGALKVSWQQNSLQWIGVGELMVQEIDLFPVKSFRALGYRIVGPNIAFYPIPQASQTYRLIYAPAPADLAQPTTGTTTSIAISGSTVTLTAATGVFHPGMVGSVVTISGASNSGNNGSFIITAATSTTCVFTNASGVNEGAGAAWSVNDAIIDGVAGWDELLVVDGAIKCYLKEESDTGPLEQRKAYLLARIQEAAEERAMASSRHIVEADDRMGYIDAADWWPRRGVRGFN
jgi:hypothetical protein